MRVLCCCLALALFAGCTESGEKAQVAPSVAPGANELFSTPEGRTAAVEIFDAAERDEYQKPTAIIENLDRRRHRV